MQIIDAINTMIGYIGEAPLDADDPDYTLHPLYESALRLLNSTSRTVQSRGWWFNERTTTLTPVSDTIAVDPDAILAVAVTRGYGIDYTVRGGALYDMTNGTAVISTPLRAVIREYLDFTDLPESAAEFIKEEASVRFIQTYDGDRSKLHEAKENRTMAYALFNAEHIKQSKVNLFQTQSMGPVIANTWHTRYRLR